MMEAQQTSVKSIQSSSMIYFLTTLNASSLHSFSTSICIHRRSFYSKVQCLGLTAVCEKLARETFRVQTPYWPVAFASFFHQRGMQMRPLRLSSFSSMESVFREATSSPSMPLHLQSQPRWCEQGQGLNPSAIPEHYCMVRMTVLIAAFHLKTMRRSPHTESPREGQL